MAMKSRPLRNVTPDKVDLRDRPYQPSVAIAPSPAFRAKARLAVLDQGEAAPARASRWPPS